MTIWTSERWKALHEIYKLYTLKSFAPLQAQNYFLKICMNYFEIFLL